MILLWNHEIIDFKSDGLMECWNEGLLEMAGMVGKCKKWLYMAVNGFSCLKMFVHGCKCL